MKNKKQKSHGIMQIPFQAEPKDEKEMPLHQAVCRRMVGALATWTLFSCTPHMLAAVLLLRVLEVWTGPSPVQISG